MMVLFINSNFIICFDALQSQKNGGNFGGIILSEGMNNATELRSIGGNMKSARATKEVLAINDFV
jgi:hypothetical protein